MSKHAKDKAHWAVQNQNPKFLWDSGSLVEWDKALVHASTLGWSAISMVFEGIRGYWSKENEELYIFHLDEHLRRLLQSMKIMRIGSRWSCDELRMNIIGLLKANEFQGDCYIQPLAYFGDGHPGYLASGERDGDITILARQSSSVLGSGQVVSCGVSSWGRLSDNVMPPRAKAIANYQNSRYVANEASVNGYDFGVLLNHQGKVSEVSYACIYIVRDGIAITPPVTAGILESITRLVVMELLKRELEIEVVVRDIDRTEMYIADEIFLCGTGAELRPVGNVDGYQVGNGRMGPIVTQLESLYHGIVRGANKRYSRWLTPVH